MLFALPVLLTTCTVAGCHTTPATATAAIPGHQCTSWNCKSSGYQGKYSYGPGYIVQNDVWNPCADRPTVYSCHFDSFYVEANVQTRPRADSRQMKRYETPGELMERSPKISPDHG